MPRKIVKSKHFFEIDFIETIGEVQTDKIEQWAPNEKLKYIGKPIPRIDGYDKVSGNAKFTYDIYLSDLAYAKILTSPLPHAKIKSIDISKAKELEGVIDIITHENVENILWFSEMTKLFDTHLRFEGDEIAAIAAESEQIAEDAIKLIKVEFEELPFVSDSSEAMKPESSKVHDNGNIQGEPAIYTRGNVEQGFSESDFIVEDTFSTQVVLHNPTEVHCSVVNWDGNNLTIWDSTQGIFAVRKDVAKSLNIPEKNVRVIKKYMGGGFGSKLEAGKYTVMAALLAKRINRPVSIKLNRRQMNLSVGNRPDSYQKLKGGVKKDGTLTALQHYSYGTVGAYPNWAGCSSPLASIYKCSNVKTEEYSVYTNNGRARPFRAPGHVQGTFALESLIDELAEKAGINPLEFRINNYAEIDQTSNQPYTTKRLKEAYEKGAEAIGWYSKRKSPGSDSGYLKRGIGMASQIWWGGGAPPSYAKIKLDKEGNITAIAGTQDLGTGTYTFIAQVTAEVLEIPIEKIKVILGDTDTGLYCHSSGGSMTAPSVAPSVRDAAEQMKQKLISAASAILEESEDELNYEEGIIFSKEKSIKISIKEILQNLKEDELITEGARNENPKGYSINSFGAQFAEVEVDTETGIVKVLKVVAAHDIGRPLNIQTLENQFHGGIIQGLGYALMEERIIDKNTGKILNPNMHDYKLPTIKDAPEIEVIIVSDFDPLISSVGVKGIGEPAIIPTAGAIANAVYNAIGVRIKSLPITPDKVLKVLYNV